VKTKECRTIVALLRCCHCIGAFYSHRVFKITIKILALFVTENCGKENENANEGSDKIVGGQDAADHQFPWQVGIVMTSSDGNLYFCGGTLISNVFYKRVSQSPELMGYYRHLRLMLKMTSF
jgi:hypothetical protein